MVQPRLIVMMTLCKFGDSCLEENGKAIQSAILGVKLLVMVRWECYANVLPKMFSTLTSKMVTSKMVQPRLIVMMTLCKFGHSCL